MKQAELREASLLRRVASLDNRLASVAGTAAPVTEAHNKIDSDGAVQHPQAVEQAIRYNIGCIARCMF